MIGASANVVTVGLAEKAGYHISLLAGFFPMLITVILASFFLVFSRYRWLCRRLRAYLG
jgi:Na+/H+ antiporter NhaD/arsenite permease-like protein